MSEKKFALPSLDKAQKKEIIRIAVVLFLIVGITALMLALVNALTFKTIEKNQQEKIGLAMSEVLPADSYEPVDMEIPEDGEVSAVYAAKGADGSVLGYCVQTTTIGFGGEIEAVFGVSKENKITKAKIVSMSETPGVGTKTNDEAFLSRFEDKSGTLTVTKGEVKAETEVAAISGATVSSRAVTAGANAALGIVGRIAAESAEPVKEAEQE